MFLPTRVLEPVLRVNSLNTSCQSRPCQSRPCPSRPCQSRPCQSRPCPSRLRVNSLNSGAAALGGVNGSPSPSRGWCVRCPPAGRRRAGRTLPGEAVDVRVRWVEARRRHGEAPQSVGPDHAGSLRGKREGLGKHRRSSSPCPRR